VPTLDATACARDMHSPRNTRDSVAWSIGCCQSCRQSTAVLIAAIAGADQHLFEHPDGRCVPSRPLMSQSIDADDTLRNRADAVVGRPQATWAGEADPIEGRRHPWGPAESRQALGDGRDQVLDLAVERTFWATGDLFPTSGRTNNAPTPSTFSPGHRRQGRSAAAGGLSR